MDITPLMKIEYKKIPGYSHFTPPEKKCIIKPLGSDVFQLVENCKTGNMENWGMGIDFLNGHTGKFLGGVLTKEQVVFLHTFLGDWLTKIAS